MTRRHPDQPRGHAESSLERAVADRYSIAPGEVTPADIRAYAELTAPKAPKAGRDGPRLGAALLDGYEFAASWGAFLSAVRDPADKQGVRKATQMVRNAGMAERIPSEGGFLVPWGLQEKILALMTTAIVRPRATYIPVTGLRESVPFLDNADQSTAGQSLAGMKFSIVEEGAAFTPTNPQFGRTTLEVSKFGAYLQNVPNELISDSPAFTEVFLPTIIARGLAFFEDDLFIQSGNGVSQPEALLNASAALTVDRATSDAVVVADLVGMVKGCHPESLLTASWLVSKSANDQILDLYYGAAGQVWNGTELVTAQMPVAPPQWYTPGDATSGPRILGLPAFVNDHQNAVGDTGDVILCDLGLYLVGDRGEMTVEVSSKGAGFASDASSIRIRHRVDGRFWPQSTYTTKTSQNVSALVVLR